MKFILPITFFILATCYSPGECLQCYLCVSPEPSSSNQGNYDPSKSNQGGGFGTFGLGLLGEIAGGAVSLATPACVMNGQSFDSSNSNYAEAKGASPACVKSVVRTDGMNYTIRGAIADKTTNCKAFAKQMMEIRYKKQVFEDRVIFCNECTGNYCNSGNSLMASLQIMFSTFAMLSLLYFIF